MSDKPVRQTPLPDQSAATPEADPDLKREPLSAERLPPSASSAKGWRIVAILAALTTVIVALLWWQSLTRSTEPEVQTVSREGVVSKIQKLNRLQTVAYNVDTVITSEKQGSWQRLWQDEQKGLFIARGRVVAGVDLSKLGSEMVQVTPPTESQIAAAKQQALASGNESGPIILMPDILVTLPPSEIFSVYLDNIEVYDWQLGLFNMLEADPAILEQAQKSAKQEVLERACQSGVMVQAQKNAQEQVQQLFALTGAKVTVTTQGAGACHILN